MHMHAACPLSAEEHHATGRLAALLVSSLSKLSRTEVYENSLATHSGCCRFSSCRFMLPSGIHESVMISLISHVLTDAARHLTT